MSADPPVPKEVDRLLDERAVRRRVGDFDGADALRERIAALGYRVVDTPAGSRAERIAQEGQVPERLAPRDVASVLDERPTVGFSVQWIVEGWPDDTMRGIRSIDRHVGGNDVQHIVVDAAGTDRTWPEDVEVVRLRSGVGWAAARNCGLRRARGRHVVVVDGSMEATGDILSPLERALDDPGVGVAGPFGLVTSDLRSFSPSGGIGRGSDVDAIESYLMAFRRELLAAVGFLDERFVFYRNADIEYCFRVKERGLRTVAIPLPVRKHAHRMWEATPAADRERLSSRNFNLFLDRFRDRADLTLARARQGHSQCRASPRSQGG